MDTDILSFNPGTLSEALSRIASDIPSLYNDNAGKAIKSLSLKEYSLEDDEQLHSVVLEVGLLDKLLQLAKKEMEKVKINKQDPYYEKFISFVDRPSIWRFAFNTPTVYGEYDIRSTMDITHLKPSVIALHTLKEFKKQGTEFIDLELVQGHPKNQTYFIASCPTRSKSVIPDGAFYEKVTDVNGVAMGKMLFTIEYKFNGLFTHADFWEKINLINDESISTSENKAPLAIPFNYPTKNDRYKPKKTCTIIVQVRNFNS